MPPYRIEPTPNPHSLKFSTGAAPFIERGLASYGSADEAGADPLASRLFAIDGVADILVLPQFLTITKRPDADWDRMLPAIDKVIREHLS